MSETLLTIDRQASDISAALVRGATDRTPVQFPQLVVGTKKPYKIELVSGGEIDAISGDGDYGITVSIGQRCAVPSVGTYKLTYDSETTSALAYNATPAQVQAALEALSSIGSGNVAVLGSAGKVYRIEFTGTLADTDAGNITVTDNLLSPPSTVFVSTLRDGGSGENELKIIRLRQIPPVIQSTWTAGETGWTGTLSTGSFEMLLALAEQAPFVGILEVMLTDAEGNTEPLVQQDVLVLCDVGDPTQFVPGDLPAFLTAAQSNRFYYQKSNTLSAAVTIAANALALDMADGQEWSLYETDDDFAVTTTNRSATSGLSRIARIKNTHESNTLTVTLAEDWNWPETPVFEIPPGAYLNLTLKCWGAAETDVDAVATIHLPATML